MDMSTQKAVASPWKPLKVRVFLWLWIASIASNIGTWMHEVGSGWLMTSMSASPQAIALVQVAGALPVFLLALPAGALADIVNKRRYLLAVQCWMAGVALALTLLTLTGQMTVTLLLTLTFAMGIGNALMMPAWSALAPEIVNREDVPAAVALSSLAMNVARAVGPAIAGVLVSLSGPWLTFALNSVSFAAVIIALYAWRHTPVPATLPTERLWGAIRAGVRYTRGSAPLRAVLVRTAAFFVGAVVGMALLPLLVRREMGGTALDYGVLLGSVGAGAIVGAMLLPRLRARLSADRIVMAASVVYAAVLFGLAELRSMAALAPLLFISGIAWIAVLSSLQVSVQTSVPSWVRARAVSLYILVFFGCSAAGAAGWGMVAAQVSMQAAFMGGGAVLLLGLLLAPRFKLPDSKIEDMQPSQHWPMPQLDPAARERGPVMITLEYRIAEQDAPAFIDAMRAVSQMRKRNGAFSWGLMQDAKDPLQWQEYFVEESWLEHLRHHGRMTKSDQRIEAQARQFQAAGIPLGIRHLLTAPTDAVGRAARG